METLSLWIGDEMLDVRIKVVDLDECS